jgi:hypothetical protein
LLALPSGALTTATILVLAVVLIPLLAASWAFVVLCGERRRGVWVVEGVGHRRSL